MLLTIGSAAVTSGLLYQRVKTYQENKKKKELPWTWHAERLRRAQNKNPLIKSIAKGPEFDKKTDSIISFTSNGMTRVTEILHLHKFGFLSKHRQQMEDMAGGRYEIISPAEKKANQAFAIASVNLGIAGMSLFYPPMIWLAVPGMIVNCVHLYEVAYDALFKEHRVSSYVLDAIAAIGALVGQYFYALAILNWTALLGHKLLLQSEHHTKSNLSHLFGEQPRTVWVLTHDQACPEAQGIEVEMAFEALQVGDTITVSAGQMIPVDGVIQRGIASIDQHKLTGESQPIEKGVGDLVLASTVVLAGKLHIQVHKTGDQTVAMQIGELLEETADFKNSVQSRGEAIADGLVLPTLGLSLVTFPLLGFSSALAVLCNKFGYKMRIYAPASMLSFLDIATQEGIHRHASVARQRWALTGTS